MCRDTRKFRSDMIYAFVIALVASFTFFCLWRDEVEERKKAQLQVWMLQRKLKQKEKELQKDKPKPPKRPSRKSEPATIEVAQPAREYVIRKPEPEPVKPLLDPRKLAELQQQTREAQSMLAEIFVQEEEKPMPPTPDAGRPVFIGIMEKLFAKEEWTRAEIVEMAGPNVMIGNLLEQINDYACSRIDDIVLEEDGDRIYVTLEYKDRLI